MKAICFSEYGDPKKVLSLREVQRPTPKGREVLVKVHASAVNDYDWSLIKGKPYLYRLMFGLKKPKSSMCIPGMEMAGTIEAAGQEVENFKEGDEVYGDTSSYGFGTIAEHISIDERTLALKPATMSFEEAACIPHASMLALQGLKDIGQLRKNENVLINGAGGGVGTFGIQLAKLENAEVTGVDTGQKLEMMKDLGFDHVLDYKQVDFTRTGEKYDLILDCKTNRSPLAYLRALKSNGRYVTVGGNLNKLAQLLCYKPFLSLLSNKRVHIVALRPNKDLSYMNSLYQESKIKVIIDGPYPFEKAPWAIQYYGEGKHQGKVIVSMSAL